MPKMLPSQQLELAIYKHLRVFEPLPADVSLAQLSQITGEKNQARIEERLIALDDQHRIQLTKWSGGTQLTRYQFNNDTSFFHSSSFSVKIAPQGRSHFEELEQQAEQDKQQPLVFISCGQFHPKEIQLGKELAAKVEELTKLKGYFAENRNTLAGLSNDIFRALEQCAALVAVMHHRGEVETLSGRKHLRGSIWIEQEIAIAAFLTATLNRDIPVLLYTQRGIKREGVREQLKLSPFEFDNEAEVLTDFIVRLKNGSFPDVP
jgi:hypothetical protein